MGNKHSHDESDSEEKHHSGTFRDRLKAKTHGIPTPKHSRKEDEVDHGRRMSSNSTNSSEKDPNELGLDVASPDVKSPSKQDGITKLAKELIIRSQQEDIKDGISIKVFTKYVCHGSIPLGQALFKDFQKYGKNSKKSNLRNSLSKEQFVLGCQKVLQLIGDEKILSFFVQVFSSENEVLTNEDVNHFLQSCYELSTATSSTCIYSDEVAKMFIVALFHGKSSLSTNYVVHWVGENCSRLVTWMHRHIVHRLTVGHRILQQSREAKTEVDIDFPSNNETPILDMAHRSSFSFSPSSPESPYLKNYMLAKAPPTLDAEQLLASTKLHPMQIWLLGCTLPSVYTRPNATVPNSPSVNGICLMDPRAFITRMLASHSPSNWTLLYDSDNDGLSLNRFEHHVMGYRGPTVTFMYGDGDRTFCLAVDQPWKESIQFWGSPNCIIIQLTPEYRVLDHGEKLMYYNTSVRGYPFGIQMGTDHRNPCLEIDKELSRLSYRKIPYRLEAVKVWGCGTAQQRESQLEIKKWELKQVEKSRNVKLTAVDWNDHPDKCLLEMASHRPSYSQFGNA